jgi:abnormal spindle-like microcephaly-associated protein
VFDASGCVDDGDGESHRKGVARNFGMVHRAAKSLGAVPEMLSSKDFADHGPDERAVILYVAFLCSRLLEVSKEERAAHTIQCAWQAHKNRAVGKDWACIANGV